MKEYIYLDHASTTPIDERVLSVMYEYDKNFFANSSSLYIRGAEAKKKLEQARKDIALFFQSRKEEVYFTSGGTESNNMAIIGVVGSFKKENKGVIPHVIVSSIEHASVIDTVANLHKQGDIELTYISPKKNGTVRPLDYIEALKENTVLVSLMLVNNEIGTVQPVGNLGKLIREHREKKKSVYPYIHTDACQGTNYELVTAPRLRADLITINASKAYGPKAVGALYIRTGVRISPIIFGGAQERGLRSGTENVALMIGLAESLKIAREMMEEESERLQSLQKHLIHRLTTEIGGVHIWGDVSDRTPNNVSVNIPGISAEELVIRLSVQGFEVSSKSACSSIDTDGSYVILAIGGTEVEARQTLRITMGRSTTVEQINDFLQTLKKILTKYRNDLHSNNI